MVTPDDMETPIASGIKVHCAFSAIVDITDLKKNPRNYNQHPDKQIALLSKNIRSMGWRSPIKVSNRSGFIVSGHARLEAAQLLKVEKVPVDFQDFASEAEEYACLVSDNKIAELAFPDLKILKDLMSDLDAVMGLKDPELTGYSEEEFQSLMETGSLPDSDGQDPQGQGKECTCPSCGTKFKA